MAVYTAQAIAAVAAGAAAAGGRTMFAETRCNIMEEGETQQACRAKCLHHSTLAYKRHGISQACHTAKSVMAGLVITALLLCAGSG